ncbi:MAG: tetratricopeptide repeat protein [Microcoleaceae cyanobacterium]
MNLSLCMIVKNEAENLPGCLESVQAVVREMVVLDTGSTDRTPKIAEAFGATVHSFNWCDDFAAARNVALGHTTQDWVLVLDADERLSPDIEPQLQELTAIEDCLVINLIRQEIGAVQSPYSLVSRLFRKHPKVKFSRPYHASIDDSVAALLTEAPHWKITSLPETAILHYGYQAQAIAQRNKTEVARRAMERYLKQNPTDPYVASKLGALYVEIGEFRSGIQLLEKAIGGQRSAVSEQPSVLSAQRSAIDPGTLYELHYHLGIAYRKQQDPTQAVAHYQAALELNVLPQLKLGAYNNLASLYKAAGDLAQAKMLYEQMLKIDPNFAIGHYNLGMTLRALGQYQGAIDAYERAIQLNPQSAETYQNLGVVLLQLGQVSPAMERFRQAIYLYQQQNPQLATDLSQNLRQMGFRV